jgi:beta-glucosidase
VVKTKIIKAQDGLTVTVPVTNTSSYAGDEVIQVYVKRNDDLNAPVKSLRAFDRVHFEPGETKNVDLHIDSGSFEFYDEKVDGMVLKPGVYTIYYGGTSLEEDQMSFQLTVEV